MRSCALIGINAPQIKTDADDPPFLPVVPVPLKGKKDMEGYQVMLPAFVERENAVTVEIEMMLMASVIPYPKEITQVEIVLSPLTLTRVYVAITTVCMYLSMHITCIRSFRNWIKRSYEAVFSMIDMH